MNEQSDEILTIEEVATYLKAGQRTVYRPAANGQIPAFKLGDSFALSAGVANISALDKPERLVVEVDALQSKLILLVGNAGKTWLLSAWALRLNPALFSVGVKLRQRLLSLYNMALRRSEEQ